MTYEQKYLKYKKKYFELKKLEQQMLNRQLQNAGSEEEEKPEENPLHILSNMLISHTLNKIKQQ
jgi:hypothetical protein